jgi:hypothetical protein
VHARHSGESVPAAQVARHRSRPHWTTSPQHFAQSALMLRASRMHMAVQALAPIQRRPHSATRAAMSMRLTWQSLAFTQAPAVWPQLAGAPPPVGGVAGRTSGVGALPSGPDGVALGGGDAESGVRASGLVVMPGGLVPGGPPLASSPDWQPEVSSGRTRHAIAPRQSFLEIGSVMSTVARHTSW